MNMSLRKVLKPVVLILFASILFFTLITIAGAKIEGDCSVISERIVKDKGDALLEPNGDESGYYKNGAKIPWRIREQLKCEREQMRPILIFGGLGFLSALIGVIIWRKNSKHRTTR